MEEVVKVNGINIRYNMQGNGEAVLFLHGLGFSHEIWDSAAKVASRFYRTCALDLPGFGDSDKPVSDYGLSFYVNFIKDFMDATGIDNAALVGVSLGAEIAAGFAAKCPGRVSRLALSAPTGLTPLYRGLQGIPLVVTSTYSLMAWSKDRYKRYAENMLYRIKPASGPIVWKEWKRMKDPAYRAVLVRNALNLSLVDPAFEASLGSIRAPTLLIWGRNDRVIPLTDATLYQDRIQGSDLVVLERCGHVPPLEQADAFISAFMTFLGREELYFGDESVGEQA